MLYFLVQRCSSLDTPNLLCVPRQPHLFMSSTPVDVCSNSQEIMLQNDKVVVHGRIDRSSRCKICIHKWMIALILTMCLLNTIDLMKFSAQETTLSAEATIYDGAQK